ncbi:MAG: PepSY-associated TM helix domain-containing protein [Gammaproteobacteria bacterium]|nr:PepSY-associated TM helix domain-containing protein [Gammaproteobacteria bacterium]
MSPRRRRLFEKLRSLYLWHRYVGLAAALLIIWLASTGIFLNHTEDLDLPQSHVSQDWLLDAYGIQAATSLQGYHIGDHWITAAGSLTYINRQRLHNEQDLVGAIETEFGFVLAYANQLQLYTDKAVLVETLPFTATSAAITAIGRDADGTILIDTNAGRFRSDSAFLDFSPVTSDAELSVIEEHVLPDALLHDVAEDIRHHTLDWERVMLDLHSGRILGVAGKWIADAVAIAMLLLAVSGVLVWLRRWRSRRSKLQR